MFTVLQDISEIVYNLCSIRHVGPKIGSLDTLCGTIIKRLASRSRSYYKVPTQIVPCISYTGCLKIDNFDCINKLNIYSVYQDHYTILTVC